MSQFYTEAYCQATTAAHFIAEEIELVNYCKWKGQ